MKDGRSSVAGQGIVVRSMCESDVADWDLFVQTHDKASFFHRSGWSKIFKRIFHLEPHYLIAEREAKIVGILPLVFQRSRLFGNALISTPFCVEGGPIGIDPSAVNAITQEALKIQADLKAPYIEFRGRSRTQPDWKVKGDLYATFSRTISADDQENLLAIPRKQRAVVRKTLDSDLTSEVTTRMEDVFRVYAESVHNLGTPVFPKRYFETLVEVFGGDCDAIIIRQNDVPVSAVLNFYHRDTVLPYYGGGTKQARRNGANDFLYWEVMRRAAARGYRRFDFGRSKAGTGAFAFKKNWGFVPEWLEYEYHIGDGHSMPDKNPLNPKYALFIKTWKLLPLWIANITGPWIIRGLG